jgi:dipeptidyl aminopeptidase/acylaminoacyl peptidase
VIHVQIETDDLLKWAGYFDELPKKTPDAIARALNSVGGNVLEISVDYFAEGSGLDAVDVRPLIEVHEATAGSLRWMMDASAVVLMDSPNWERPWDKPDTGGNFQAQQTLQIVTSGDGRVCAVCAQAAEDSPYTVEDINKLKAKWKDWNPPRPGAGEMTNLIHPYCRCRTVPWIQSRRLNVQFATTPPSPPVVLNVRQLGQAIATELGGILKVTP